MQKLKEQILHQCLSEYVIERSQKLKLKIKSNKIIDCFEYVLQLDIFLIETSWMISYQMITVTVQPSLATAIKPIRAYTKTWTPVTLKRRSDSWRHVNTVFTGLQRQTGWKIQSKFSINPFNTSYTSTFNWCVILAKTLLFV